MNHSIFHPGGPAAAAVAKLGWTLAAVCAVIYVIVVVIFVWAWLRNRSGIAPPATAEEPPEHGKRTAVAAALFATIAILTAFVAASAYTDHALMGFENGPTVRIDLTAHQWWWELRYVDADASRGFVTANELHLPVGEPVAITLHASDVIHSFWIPALGPKRDIIPGRPASIVVRADAPGEWLGRCAEFCGAQHAHMELTAIAEPRAQFDAWRAHQAEPSRPPQGDEEKRGEQVFASAPCALCHVIRGSAAGGYSGIAPDLTHLKSRRTIAAGTLPNSKGHLAGWIADPQSLKPGVLMPVNPLPPADFQALLAYLETLQ